jgi:pyocin large subunit-like protein
MGDVLDSVVKEARSVDPSAKLWTSTKKYSNAQNMWEHWVSHQSDFPDIHDGVTYVQRAMDFVNNPTQTMKIGTRTGANALGQVVEEKVFLDMSNGHFAVQVISGPEAGALKTFFPKTGIGPGDWLSYWNKQNITHLIQ